MYGWTWWECGYGPACAHITRGKLFTEWLSCCFIGLAIMNLVKQFVVRTVNKGNPLVHVGLITITWLEQILLNHEYSSASPWKHYCTVINASIMEKSHEENIHDFHNFMFNTFTDRKGKYLSHFAECFLLTPNAHVMNILLCRTYPLYNTEHVQYTTKNFWRKYSVKISGC